MARSLLTVAALFAMLSVVTVRAGDFNWNFEEYVRGAVADGLSAFSGEEEHNKKEESAQPAPDALVCTQEVVCGADGETYPNPCLAKEAGVEVVPCPEEARSGPLLGIPDALLDIGHGFIDMVKAPLTGGKKKNEDKNGGSGGGFNPVDPLNLFRDPFDQLFQGLGRRRLRMKSM